MSYANDVTAAALRDASGATFALGTLAAGALLMRSGSTLVGLAGSAQGSAIAWDATGSIFKDTSRSWNIGTTSTAGVTLANTTAATAGVPVQYSPALQFDGTASDTDAGPASVIEKWRIENRPVSGTTVTSSLHFLHAQGAGAFSSLVSITQAGHLYCNVLYSTLGFIAGANTGCGNNGGGQGLGTTSYFYTSANQTLCMLSSGASMDAPSSIVSATVYDRNAASITNAATMRLHSFGWTNNADTFTELAAVYCDGSVWSSTGFRVPSFTVAGVPTAAAAGRLIYVSNGDAGSPCLAVWDGSNYRRIAFGAAISAT